MKAVKVQYTVKSEYANRNKENIKNVMAELRLLNNSGIKYSTFILDDNKSFVHFAMFNNEEAHHIFRNLGSFKKFQEELRNSGPEIPPVAENISLVGSSYPIFEKEEIED